MSLEKVLGNFDVSAQGVWYPIALGVFLLIFVLCMPKRLSWKEMYITFGVVGWIAMFTDLSLASPFDLFDLGSAEKEGIGDLLSYGVIPALFALIYLNFYQKDKKWLFVIIFTGLSLLAHWGLVEVGYMKHKHWNVWWDTPVLLFVYALFLPWHYHLMRKTLSE